MREYDFDTKLVRFGARDYDPTIGRWTTKYPIGFAGGDTNLYAYVGGNPMSYSDPTGLKTEVRCRPLAGKAGKVGSHCYLVITPEAGSSLGTKEITLSLFPEGGMGISSYSTGIKAINDKRDSDNNYNRSLKDNVCGRSADDFDKAILDTFNNMPSHSVYSNNPSSALGFHNSNSFVSEIIKNAGGAKPNGIPSNAYGF